MVEALLRKGADINATGGRYDCALRAAAWYGHVEVLRVLLDNGAVSDTQGRPYRRALQDAIEEGHQEIARIVFGEGAQKQLAITQASCDLRLKVRYDHNR
jgi:ankyrin repeat protein